MPISRGITTIVGRTDHFDKSVNTLDDVVKASAQHPPSTWWMKATYVVSMAEYKYVILHIPVPVRLLSVTPLIEKDEGSPYLTRLRVIHLLQADYNLFLKLVYGKRLVRNAEKANALNDQQHGSRPRRMTTDSLILARLEKDIIRQIMANSAHMDNNATGCYDCLVVSLGMLACCAGMKKLATACQANALRNMHYAIKQLTGISLHEYYGTPEEPLFGTGQGSGASGATWLCLTVILLNCLD